MCPTASLPPPEPLLTVEGLDVVLRHGQSMVHALRGVSFTVGEGEAVAVIGDAQSGKAALLQAILGVLPEQARPAQTGTIRLGRLPPAALRRDLPRQAGVVFRDEANSLDPAMRAGAQLAERAPRRAAIPALLASAGLSVQSIDLFAFPHQLSAEQRQRLMLAMALAHAPQLLLLEDPAARLDSIARAAFLRTVAALRTRGLSILLLTADITAAAAVATRAIVLHAGRVVETGALADLLARPAHPLTEALVAARSTLDADRSRPRPAIATDKLLPSAANPEGCAFRGPCPAGSTRCAQQPPLGPAGWHGGEVACWNAASPARRTPPPPRWPALPAGSAAPLLVLEGVSRGPGGAGHRTAALHDIGLHVREREAVGVVGPAGCGKSTLLRFAAGLQRPAAGRRTYAGEAPPQMIFADPLASLPPWLTVGQIVGERLLRRGLSAAERVTRVEEALALVQLPPELAAKAPRDLTLGQAQRVALARAMVVPPPLLLCDDPLAALDGPEAAGILNLLAALRRSNRMALLLASSDIAAARYATDRLIVLDHGHIAEEGPFETVIAAPASLAARALIEAVPGSGA